MNIQPIPLFLLIHAIDYHEYREDSRFDNQYGEPVTFKHVRIEPYSHYNSNGTGDVKTYRAVLFIDAVNSKPNDGNLKEKSKVIYNGDEMIVGEVQTLFAIGERAHHWEVLLE
ncbi:putative minor capsid protein [Bacillus thuringiensis]|uniref:putative minor capsid protein n=1 Tax=Bacillus thuringiensis TaxID=1428 RepID=UPI0015D4A858|nr:putative minor capsid protein [Bacillus thuringiensis]